MCEVFKSLNCFNPSFMTNLFTFKTCNFNLRAKKLLVLPLNNTFSRGTNTNLYKTISAWNSLSPHVMNEISLQSFKQKNCDWTGKGCACKICKT